MVNIKIKALTEKAKEQLKIQAKPTFREKLLLKSWKIHISYSCETLWITHPEKKDTLVCKNYITALHNELMSSGLTSQDYKLVVL